MNLDSRSVAAPSGFRQTPRIALGKRARFNESLKDQIAGRRNSSSRRTSRVAARSGSFHIESHWSGSFFAGRRSTTFQQPSIKIAVEHPASTLRDFDGGRTFAERNKAFKRASDYSGSCRGLVVRQNLH
jgi:hypothetical protein